nr:hypothetical protein [uncultured Caldimonas sp.]
MHIDAQKRSLKRMAVFGVARAILILMAGAGALMAWELKNARMRYLLGGLAVQPGPLTGAINFVVFLLVPPRIGGFYWKDLTSGYRYRLDGKDSTHQPCRVPG